MPDTGLIAPGTAPIPAAAGIGLRFPHHRAIREEQPAIAWLEVHAENYMGGGAAVAQIEAIRRDYPVSLHGVGLSPGSADGIDRLHLDRLACLAERLQPGLVSEHLSWSTIENTYLADLLPLPLTEESLTVVCGNVTAIQDRLQRAILIENTSSYLRYAHDTIPEWEFLGALASRTGCGILCDVNNIHVVACNHEWDARTFIEALPAASVGELHLAGHSIRDLDGGRPVWIDDHASRVHPAVWELYRLAIARFGAVPTLIEWDNAIPPLATLLDEAATAQSMLDRTAGVADADAA